METLSIIAGGIVILAVVVSAIKRAQKKKAEEVRLLREFGFHELRQIEPQFENRVKTLAPRRSSKLRIVNLFRHDRSDGKIYIFDLYTDGKNAAAYKSAAVVSRDLDLPRFSLYPKIKLGGFLGKTLNRIVKYIISKELQEINPDWQADFAEKYQLFGKDPRAVKRLFSETPVRRLIEKNILFQIEAEADTLLFSRFNPKMDHHRGTLSRDRLQKMLDDARMLIRLFRECDLSAEKNPAQKLS